MPKKNTLHQFLGVEEESETLKLIKDILRIQKKLREKFDEVYYHPEE